MVWYDFALRVFMAHALISVKWQQCQRMAWLRTNALVAAGSALYVIIEVFTNEDRGALRRNSLEVVLLLTIWAVSLPAHAGRPMVTDDAGIVDAKACQLETWVQKNHGSAEYWAVPACNFTGNLEVAVGGARINAPEDRQTVAVVQGKTLFKPLETNGWGVGLAFGNRFHPNRSLNGDLYAYVPLSFSFHDNRVLLHTNLGWLHEKETGRHRMTWGVGSEWQLAEQTWFSIETFGQNEGKPFYQIATRHWLVPDRVQIDATYGNRFDQRSEGRWFSVGLKFVSVPFLP